MEKKRNPNKTSDPSKPLNIREDAFCREYVIDFNGTQAAIRAGYSSKGASVHASRLLLTPKINKRLAELIEERNKRTEVSADWVLKRLVDDVTADLASLYDEHGHLKQMQDWPMAFRTGLVAGLETALEKDGEDADGKPIYTQVRKVKLADRSRLLEMLGRHVNVAAFKDRVEVDVKDELALRLKEARERVKRR